MSQEKLSYNKINASFTDINNNNNTGQRSLVMAMSDLLIQLQEENPLSDEIKEKIRETTAVFSKALEVEISKIILTYDIAYQEKTGHFFSPEDKEEYFLAINECYEIFAKFLDQVKKFNNLSPHNTISLIFNNLQFPPSNSIFQFALSHHKFNNCIIALNFASSATENTLFSNCLFSKTSVVAIDMLPQLIDQNCTVKAGFYFPPLKIPESDCEKNNSNKEAPPQKEAMKISFLRNIEIFTESQIFKKHFPILKEQYQKLDSLLKKTKARTHAIHKMREQIDDIILAQEHPEEENNNNEQIEKLRKQISVAKTYIESCFSLRQRVLAKIANYLNSHPHLNYTWNHFFKYIEDYEKDYPLQQEESETLQTFSNIYQVNLQLDDSSLFSHSEQEKLTRINSHLLTENQKLEEEIVQLREKLQAQQIVNGKLASKVKVLRELAENPQISSTPEALGYYS